MKSLTPVADAVHAEAEHAAQVKADRLEAAKRLVVARKRLEREGPAANSAMAAANARIVALRETWGPFPKRGHAAAA